MKFKGNIVFILIILVISAIVTFSYFWNIKIASENVNNIVKSQSKAFFSELITAKEWNAEHGGVYVPVTKEIQPNTYLDVPDSDVYTTDSVLLTKINTEFMTRLISKKSEQKNGVRFHIADLNPINPDNKADEWETKALQEFNKGKKEVFEYFKKDTLYRYMAPLIVNDVWIKYHEQQGYKIGDIRGGISVSTHGANLISPLEKQKLIILITHILVLFGFIVLTIIFWNVISRQFKKINKENNELTEQNSELNKQSKGYEKLNQQIFAQKLEVEQANFEINRQTKEQEKLNQQLFAQKLEVEQANFEINRQSEEQEKLNQQLFAQRLEVEQKNMEIELSYKNLELLGAIGKKIVSLLTVEDILESAYKNISDLMHVTLFAIGIYNEEKDRIEYPGTIKDNKKLPLYYYETTKPNSFSVWCFKNREEIFINNLDKEYKKYLDAPPELKAFKAQSFIYCPLTSNEKTIGTVTVHHNNKDAFTDYNLFVMRNIATYISLAIQNANSYQQIEEHMQEISIKNEIVKSSINYAKTIQSSMMISEQILHDEYNTELVYFPKDIVSGDFYWTANIFNKRKFITAVDCTGHGVPGAFLSFVGSKSLDEIVHSKQLFQPKKILSALDDNIKEILNQERSNNRDGMDVSMCAIEETKGGKMKVIFSGAKLPLFYYQKTNKKVNYIKGSRKSIGGGYYDESEFEEHELLLEKGDILYIATDGYIDQDGKEHKRFGRNKFMSMIERLAEFPPEKQRVLMKQIFEKYKGGELQRDDVTVLISVL